MACSATPSLAFLGEGLSTPPVGPLFASLSEQSLPRAQPPTLVAAHSDRSTLVVGRGGCFRHQIRLSTLALLHTQSDLPSDEDLRRCKAKPLVGQTSSMTQLGEPAPMEEQWVTHIGAKIKHPTDHQLVVARRKDGLDGAVDVRQDAVENWRS